MAMALLCQQAEQRGCYLPAGLAMNPRGSAAPIRCSAPSHIAVNECPSGRAVTVPLPLVRLALQSVPLTGGELQ